MIKILALETSCDETAVAVVDSHKRILAHVIRSQIEEHQLYGGVVPELASRAHLEYLPSLVTEALKKAGLGYGDLSAIAATTGPGLMGGLLVGATFAKAVAFAGNLPFLGINHLEGHALTVRLTHDVPFPYLLLLTSGGHCQILEVRGVGDYKELGTTLDDAAGEAFDKVAKMLGLGFPGGPAVEKMALKGQPNIPLPRPLMEQNNYNFSFSGLKTAVLQYQQKHAPLSSQTVADLCASFQAAVKDCFVNRLAKAIHALPSCMHVVVAGGVAANVYLRDAVQVLCTQQGRIFVAPPSALCTDNAAMIAWAAIERMRLGHQDPLNIRPRPRWPLKELVPCTTGF
jgi:N6-L-threonylcarbamoyladenine synthase